MKAEKLALHGGTKSIQKSFTKYNHIGPEEIDAVIAVLKSGVLSQFLGTWHPDFFGGPVVQKFEQKFASYFGMKHAVSVNSATSGLIAAIGALGVEPGDEVIVSPWTMCATATAILHWNAIPVFADIEPETFNLSPESIRKSITPFTRAIIVTDIFGHSADIDSIMDIANEYDIKVISDSAQAPGALYKNQYAGTKAHVGSYSLNYHKHIHTGEGGVLVTNDDQIKRRLQLIRNHAEAVVEGMGESNISNMVGYNFRMGEIEAAIGIEQLDKLEELVSIRQECATQLSEGIKHLNGLRTPVIKSNCSHAFYIFPLVVDENKTGVSRDDLCRALVAEGIEGISPKYVNIHLLPIFQRKIAYGSNGFPWKSNICKREVSYEKGICPVAESMQDKNYMGISMCLNDLSTDDINLMIGAFIKVWGNLDSLRKK